MTTSYKYQLIATNKQRLTVKFKGDTIKDVIGQFKSEYSSTKGFVIDIYNNQNADHIKTIKSTFR